MYLPEFSLAIEYNGEGHYKFIPLYDELETTQRRDKVKKYLCESNGITLLVVPYWWDKSAESLARTIHELRPDITVPPSFLAGRAIPDVMPRQREMIRGEFYPKQEAQPSNTFDATGWYVTVRNKMSFPKENELDFSECCSLS